MKISPILSVPNNIERPLIPHTQSDYDYCYNKPYILKPKAYYNLILLQEIIKLKDVCKMTKEVLDYANEIVKEGITTDEIDKAVFFFYYIVT